MLDHRLLIDDFDRTAELLARKKYPLAASMEARDLVTRRRAILSALEEKRARVKSASKTVGELMAAGNRAEADTLRAELAEAKTTLKGLEPEYAAIDAQVEDLLLRIPNLPEASAPIGMSEDANVLLRIAGYDAERFAAGSFRPHWEIGAELDILDAERGAKVSGNMFTLLKGDGALLLRSLVNFGLDLNREKYLEVAPPHFVRSATFTATGHLPKFEADAYRLRDDDLWAIPTGEVPLMGMHRDEILDGETLPRRYMAYTVCFRREAGSAGKDTRGMQRLHEFHKVELVILCREDQFEAEFQGMVADAERPLQRLGLPYRVLDLCTSDLTFGAARTYDLEVYAPGAAKWLEVSSVGKYTTFQTRRGNMRYRDAQGKIQHLWAMNGSGLATPRVWAAVVEHGYQPDGRIKVPEALQPYVGKEFLESRNR